MTDTLLSSSSIEAILFDLDGTLVKTNDHWATTLGEKLAPLKRLFPRMDSSLLARRLLVVIEAPVNYLLSLLEHLGLGTGFFGLADWIRHSKGLATREAPSLIEGSEALLQALSGSYKLAVVTTRGHAEANAFIEHTELAHFFSAVITRRDVLCLKPHPQPVREAAARLGVPTEHCLMVGDTGLDVRSARRAGAYAVGVLSGVGKQRELERAKAHLILERAVELLDHLRVPREARLRSCVK